MNRNKLKTYAPQARRDFIQAVTDRATHFGLTAKKIEPMTEQGEVVLIGGRPFPKSVGAKRKKLESRIQKLGFEQTMEAMAYTWFNRLVAIRFMELHGYLEHGFRVLSHPEDHPQPEILEHAQHVDLPGLNQKKVVELKLDGTKEEELYRLVLITQCNALHKALPFLFESIDDETELLLPDRLLHSDSLIRNLVNEIPEEDWQEVEIIGWLYQFYISDKKDEVIGKVVASEDIPAATQLFTPNWIVKYLVQNTLGRQWLATYPNSPLKGQMEYYIEPAEQTLEVQDQLRAITPTSLDPEELTLLDPACGSGHILVEAYDLFKAIYTERGYRAKDIPALILLKNLFGLEIDDRAAQLAAFALMMKSRADDRSIFDRDVQPQVVSIQESKGLNAEEITNALNQPILKEKQLPPGELFEDIADERSPLFSRNVMGDKGGTSQSVVAQLLDLFEHGKTFGSLIHVPAKLAEKLPALIQRTKDVIAYGGMFERTLARILTPLVEQAQVLARTYHAVLANPPYMNSKGMLPHVKSFAQRTFPDAKSDVFAMFIERTMTMVSDSGHLGFVTPYVWMFISSYGQLREKIETHSHPVSLVQLEYNAFEPACVPVCTFILGAVPLPLYRGTFISLTSFTGHQNQAPRTREAIATRTCPWRFDASWSDFAILPGRPICFTVGKRMRQLFALPQSLGDVAKLREGIHTGNNERFLRLWQEVDFTTFSASEISIESVDKHRKRWIPYNKGGPFRKWYGNNSWVVAFDQNGRDEMESVKGHVRPSKGLYFKEGGTWSALTSGHIAVRYYPNGFLFDSKGQVIVEGDTLFNIALMNSAVYRDLAGVIMPTLDYKCGDVRKLPFLDGDFRPLLRGNCQRAIAIAKSDWDSVEESWDFIIDPLLQQNCTTIESAWSQWDRHSKDQRLRMKELEEQNNQILIATYELAGEVEGVVPEEQITLRRQQLSTTVANLLSYFIGCIMGRYSLDKSGLIYAGSGNRAFDPSNYSKFPADEDGIIPLTEFCWFSDDAAVRFESFVATVWPAEHLEENLTFVAESLGAKKGETPRDTIRRYFASDFFKNHLQKYKGPKHPPRPIYWLFCSGKLRGFQALVYLHRYNDGTLARMRTEYVIPLLGKMSARIDHLTDDISSSTSSQHRKRLETEKAMITKQLAEIQAFDEKLRHCADQRIRLDLDDGVKVNYGKFGDLLAEVKTITGGESDE